MTAALEAAQGDAGRVGGDQAAEAPSPNSRKLSSFSILPIFLQMQAGEFEVDHQHLGVRFGADDVVGEFQRVHRGEAAHEADDGALDAVAQAGLAHDLEVEAGGGEAGATCDDQVGDGGASCDMSSAAIAWPASASAAGS